MILLLMSIVAFHYGWDGTAFFLAVIPFVFSKT